MDLFKMHGLGNDYLVLETGEAMDPALCREICHRHTGIGSDGILEPMKSATCDYGVTIWNPDGTIAEKSGNGLRIFARWLHTERGAPDTFTVDTGACTVRCRVNADSIEVDMGVGTAHPMELDLDGTSCSFVQVDLGNPHLVSFADTPLDDRDWRRLGARLEVHPYFPNRTNVQFVKLEPTGPHIRIWERGAGETMASGSSSCAVVVAAVATNRLPAGRHTVHMEGGTLSVTVDASFNVRLEGPVAPIARCTWVR